MKTKWHALVVITAILAIACMAMVALISHVDGVLFVTAMTLVAGLGGWKGKALLDQYKRDKDYHSDPP